MAFEHNASLPYAISQENGQIRHWSVPTISEGRFFERIRPWHDRVGIQLRCERTASGPDDRRARAAKRVGARESRAEAHQRDSAQSVRVFCPGGARPREAMVAFINAHRDQYGVEPVCAVLPMAPSTYYLHHGRQIDPGRRPARAQRDDARRSSESGRRITRCTDHGKSGGNYVGRATVSHDAPCGD